jgi:hypothetical protein
MKFERDLNPINTDSNNPENVAKSNEPKTGDELGIETMNNDQAKIAGDSRVRTKEDSTVPRGEAAKNYISNMKAEIESHRDPSKRFNEYMELSRYAYSAGEKESWKELHNLAMKAEAEFMADIEARTAHSEIKVKNLIKKNNPELAD